MTTGVLLQVVAIGRGSLAVGRLCGNQKTAVTRCETVLGDGGNARGGGYFIGFKGHKRSVSTETHFRGPTSTEEPQHYFQRL